MPPTVHLLRLSISSDCPSSLHLEFLETITTLTLLTFGIRTLNRYPSSSTIVFIRSQNPRFTSWPTTKTHKAATCLQRWLGLKSGTANSFLTLAHPWTSAQKKAAFPPNEFAWGGHAYSKFDYS